MELYNLKIREEKRLEEAKVAEEVAQARCIAAKEEAKEVVEAALKRQFG